MRRTLVEYAGTFYGDRHATESHGDPGQIARAFLANFTNHGLVLP